MRVLELFKGSGSITNYYKDRDDVEIISLDYNSKYNPTICCDIMDFDYKKYDVGYFDIIWASPCCCLHSSLQYTHIGRKWKNREELDKARLEDSKYILKVIEIIEYLKPTYYYIENPARSSIWNYIDDLDISSKYVICDYCVFGFNYRKRTKILTNKDLDNVLCIKTKHDVNMGMYKTGQKNYPKSIEQRYSIPEKLLHYLLE